MIYGKIIFPPFVETGLHGPHLAPGLLSAILQESQFSLNVIPEDLNIKFIYKMLTIQNIEYCIERASKNPSDKKIWDISCLEWLRNFIQNNEIGLTDQKNSLLIALKTMGQYFFPRPITVKSCLRSQGSLYSKAKNIIDELMRIECSISTNVFGISVAFAEQLWGAIECAREIRRYCHDTPIILGGSQINLLCLDQIKILSESGLFDYIFLGNAENSIVDLFTTHATRANRTTIIKSKPLTKKDLENLPIPKLMGMDKYIKPYEIILLASKGCCWSKCTFCDYTKLSNLGPSCYIVRPAKDVYYEIEQINKRFGPTKIFLSSAEISPSWYKKLAEYAIKDNLKLNTHSFLLHSEKLDIDFFRKLVKAGVRGVNFGTETTINRLLKVMNKPFKRSTIFKNIEDAAKAKLPIVANVIPDFPTISFQEGLRVAEDFAEILHNISIVNAQLFTLTANTQIANEPKSFGIQITSNRLIRTNHGYHSIRFKRMKGINPFEQSILSRIFADFEQTSRTRNRYEMLNFKKRKSTDKLLFDNGIFIEKKGAHDYIHILSLRSSWCINNWERKIFNYIFYLHNYTISILKLKKIYLKETPCDQSMKFNKWLDYIAESGLIIKITSVTSDKGGINGKKKRAQKE